MGKRGKQPCNDERNAEMYRKYCSGRYTYQQLADEYSMSRQRAHQIIKRIFKEEGA